MQGLIAFNWSATTLYPVGDDVTDFHSVGRCRKRVGVHAQHSHGARRLEGGTTLSVAECPRTHNDDQANILINEMFHACLGDFGLSTIVGVERRAAANASLISVASNTSLMSFTPGGTTRWMSPELLDPDQFGITDYRPTKQSDCYALGTVVYEVRADAIVPVHDGLTCALPGPLRKCSLLGHYKRRWGDKCDHDW